MINKNTLESEFLKEIEKRKYFNKVITLSQIMAVMQLKILKSDGVFLPPEAVYPMAEITFKELKASGDIDVLNAVVTEV